MQNLVIVLALLICKPSSMQFPIFSAQGVLGECYPQTFLAGKRSITTSAFGELMELGNASIVSSIRKLHQWVRVSQDQPPSPSVAILDSQSVKTATPAAIEVGYDTAKHIKG